MITLQTQNSIYEVDPENKRYRRLSSSHEPTERQKPDGEWMECDQLQIAKPVVVGGRGLAPVADVEDVKEFINKAEGNVLLAKDQGGEATHTSTIRECVRDPDSAD